MIAVPRLALAAAAALALAGCAPPRTEMAAPPALLSDFRLGHVAVVAQNAVKSPVSRDATAEEWKAALDKAIRDRFGRIEGSRFYHLGIHVDGYALAPPGVPIVLSPKSVLIVSATVFDDAAGGKINDKPQQLTVFESLSGETMIGSGLTQTKAEQMETLAYNAALAVENWLVANPQFFGGKPRELPAE
jgi:hypothetical protein